MTPGEDRGDLLELWMAIGLVLDDPKALFRLRLRAGALEAARESLRVSGLEKELGETLWYVPWWARRIAWWRDRLRDNKRTGDAPRV